MRLVISCYKYRDTWGPFLALFEKFHGGPITLLTDQTDGRDFPSRVTLAIETGTWCEMLAKFARKVDEPILLFQDDFFINAPVDIGVLEQGRQLLERENAGFVRIYPCPGADAPIDEIFGKVSHGADYVISCQVAWWQSGFLADIARYAGGSASDFELVGRELGRSYWNYLYYSVRRELARWPLEYICSAISRGEWNPDAIRLCENLGIPIDTSMRPIAA